MDFSSTASAPRSVRAELARALARVAELDPYGVEEAELVGVVTDCAKLAAATAGMKLAAVAELARRFDEHEHGALASGAECAGAEVSLALRLTPAAADRLVVLAQGLADRLPATATALRGGRIGEDKARVLVEETINVSPDVAQRVEERALSFASRLTAPRFRRRVRVLVIETDPDGAAQRRDAAVAERRVGMWDDGEGTTTLAGSSLPAGPAIEAYHHLDAMARQLHRTEADLMRQPRTLEQVRADLFLDMIRGRSPRPSPHEDGSSAPARVDLPATNDDTHWPGDPPASTGESLLPADTHHPPPTPVGRLHLTIPFDTLIGEGQAPGEAAGYGPLLADVAQHLAQRALASPRSTLACWTVTDEHGGAVAHGTTSYRPSTRMRAEILARHANCAFPTCGQPATRCDLDHTTPYDKGGPTCPCNLAPLCRRHHRLKQHLDWRITHPAPGHLTWKTPTGAVHTAQPRAISTRYASPRDPPPTSRAP
ncbi:DUF222 domain-containing protein [Spiractinospora alimapuensis]|uniref:HNH endonuclease signature motif containing protein n=1 Tax=Spiractinospora alimapuensis TaxID=2820884 RepID=UPI001F26A789|nr:HNH endonuclease signature motif containing protein [Spiractinospora alimapuensis]QVQ54564.1 DUF222 domain-containing protein [Spiractinospora alimapuensis]